MKCRNCGVQFDEGFFCPECGTKVESVSPATNNNKPVENVIYESDSQQVIKQNEEGHNWVKQIMSIMSLLFGILALITLGSLIIPQILGVVCACLGRKHRKFQGMAKAGLICSIIATVILILLLVFLLLFV